MNITLRKLAMLEKNFEELEEIAKVQGYTNIPINTTLRENVARLMEKVKTI